jgi:acyl carrier protein
MQPEATMRADRARVRELMALVLATRDMPLPNDDSASLRGIGFRSLDFSELALRVEDEIDRELNFDAPGLRSVTTVGDVLDLIEQLQDGS